MFNDVKKMVDLCQTCMMSRKTNLRELEYHFLKTVHRPLALAYMDVLGPVTGIKSEHRYILMVLLRWVFKTLSHLSHAQQASQDGG